MDEPFEKWVLLSHVRLCDLPDYGVWPAVYGLRDSSTKDMLKFGYTGALRRRIFADYIAGFGKSRVHRRLFDDGMIERVEISWIRCRDDAEAERKEGELRRCYKGARGRCPDWERSC
jgi:hypothetical protein